MTYPVVAEILNAMGYWSDSGKESIGDMVCRARIRNSAAVKDCRRPGGDSSA